MCALRSHWRRLWLKVFASASPVVTDSGLVEGVEEGGGRVFKGIPFAAPPLGDLRWRAPAAPASWEGVRAADAFSPVCMQRGMYPQDAPPESMNEDCLYLNIWTPDLNMWTPGGASSSRLPVMVWIPGGGLENGSASTPLYHGDGLSRRGVIVVTANYRLGAFGFLAHPALSEESANAVSGNYGLLDQLAALGWVKRNISAFGGDPQNITVFGQSSGAISISVLTASPLARGLFRRAIGQSGGLFEPIEAAPEFNLAGAESAGVAFVERMKAASLAELRAMKAADILAQRFHPQPNIDGYVLTESPHAAYANGRMNDVDLLVGSNEHEGLPFLADRRVTAANLDDELAQDFPSFIVALLGPKTAADDSEARAAFIAFESDMRFGWDVWTWARLHAASAHSSTYFYRFTHTPPGEAGASHGAEMIYAFDHLDQKPLAWTDVDRRIARTLADYWTNFAKRGDPNGAGLPQWPEYSLSDERALVIGEEIGAAAIPNASSLRSIDRLYWVVRVLLEYWRCLAGGAALIVLMLVWRKTRRPSKQSSIAR
ncbi:MAG: carboxylesterase family protein [Gammaproteobacteria bacterium]|nr:carboxylesterase family protein [Gammaproteobacteria bacterium]